MKLFDNEISLNEALHIGNLVGYEMEPDTDDKHDYLLGLCHHLIKIDYWTLASCDMISQFNGRARAYVMRCG